MAKAIPKFIQIHMPLLPLKPMAQSRRGVVQILVFNAINTIVTDMKCNIRIDRLPLGHEVRTLGQSAYPDIALHISNILM
jgi:hypothetical protein